MSSHLLSVVGEFDFRFRTVASVRVPFGTGPLGRGISFGA